MGRASARNNKNAYFLKREELGLTRDEASELLKCLPPDRIEKIENERIAPHPEDVMVMADKYKAPELCNYYCANQCPIGQQYVPEVKIKNLAQIVLEMVASLNKLHQQRNRFIEITVDGQIDTEELDDFIKIQDELENISVAVETLQLWCERMLVSGAIDAEAYEARKKRK